MMVGLRSKRRKAKEEAEKETLSPPLVPVSRKV